MSYFKKIFLILFLLLLKENMGSNCLEVKKRTPEWYARKEKRRIKAEYKNEKYMKKEKKEAMRRKNREGFFRCDIDWSCLATLLVRQKALTTIIDNNLDYYDEIRRITSMSGKSVDIEICSLGNYPMDQSICSDEKKLLKLYKKFFSKSSPPFKSRLEKDETKLDFEWQNLI